MSIPQSIRNSTQWLLAGSLSGQVLSFAFGIILARLLVPEDFGLLVTVQIVTGVAGLIAGGGMGQALIRAKVASDRDFNIVFTIQFCICLLIYVFFYTAAPYFARWYHEPIYEPLLRVTALSFLLRPVVGNHSTWLARNMLFKKVALVTLVSGLLTSLSSIYMAWVGMGVWSLALSGIFGSISSWYLLSRQTTLRIRFSLDGEVARQLGGIGIRFSILDIISYVRRQTNNFILGILSGPSAVGLFNKADSLAQLPFSTLSAAVYEPVFRTLSKEQANLDKNKYLFLHAAKLLFVYTLPIYAGVSWLAEPLISVMYGSKWIGAAEPLSILTIYWAFSCLNHPAGAVLAAQNRLNQEMGQQFTALILNAIACLIGIRWGLPGVAWGLVVAGTFSHLYMMKLVKDCIKLRTKDLLLTIRPGLILCAVTLFSLVSVRGLLPREFVNDHQAVYLLVSLTVGSLVYVSALLYLPLSDISAESYRWRRVLRLSKAKVLDSP